MNNILDIKTPAESQAEAREKRLRFGESRPVKSQSGLLEFAHGSSV